jgi:hypothetical protein
MDNSVKPRRKVVVGAVAGGVVTCIIGLIQLINPHLEITAVFAAGAVTVIGAVLAYIVPEGDQA